MSITHISSPTHFRKLLDSTTYLVVDFYADWCGPCKAIAPIFEGLARSESKPGRIGFVKVDVDSQGEISKKYGVTAMPTFIIFRNSSPTTTIRGADPSGLKSAVLKASADAARSPPRESAAFSTKGHVLGPAPSSPSPSSESTPTTTSFGKASGSATTTTTAGADSVRFRGPGRTAGTGAGARGGSSGGAGGVGLSLPGGAQRLIDNVMNFLGLYFTSFFSLDPWAAAQGSRFNLTGAR